MRLAEIHTPAIPEPRLEFQREPKPGWPAWAVGSLTFGRGDDPAVTPFSATVVATASTAELEAAHTRALHALNVRIAEMVQSDPRLIVARERMLRLTQLQDADRSAHRDASTKADAASAAGRKAMAECLDPSVHEQAAADQITIRDRLGARLGERTELIRAAEQAEEDTRQAATKDAQRVVRDEYSARYAEVAKPTADALALAAAEIAECQSVLGTLSRVK